ncbi:MAG: signal transduction histidine kinase [Saprospiraceae bacterium]|jgi:signal transduction histidine kinase
MSKNTSNKFFRKISIILMSVLIVLGLAYVIITVYISKAFYQETNQQLYSGLASYASMAVEDMTQNGTDTTEIAKFLRIINEANPHVEVYLLNEQGKILLTDTNKEVVAREKVNLSPVHTFIDAKKSEKPFLLGNDPKDYKCELPFTAAKVKKNALSGSYIYILMSSQQQSSVSSKALLALVPRIGGIAFAIALLSALGIGLLANWVVTRNLRNIIDTAEKFKQGDYSARIMDEEKGDFVLLGDTFNEMATQIEGNIKSIQSVEQLRRDLIANVSHDLRTPLSIMQGYVETLLMKGESVTIEKRTHYLNIVLNSTKNLSNLVSQLFEYSKLEAQQIEPQKEPFSLADLAQDVAAKYQILAEDKEISMFADIEKDLPLVNADIALVERVMQNLMDNALKFTPEKGTIKIRVQQKQNAIEVCIMDTGNGISKKELPHIFERYHQAKKSAEKSNGAGLGLAIAKKIMEIHDTDLTVKSELGQGTEFQFSLPI